MLRLVRSTIMKTELIEKLQSVNIDSATAERIADQYFKFKYIEMVSTSITVILAIALFLWFIKRLIELLDI